MGRTLAPLIGSTDPADLLASGLGEQLRQGRSSDIFKNIALGRQAASESGIFIPEDFEGTVNEAISPDAPARIGELPKITAAAKGNPANAKVIDETQVQEEELWIGGKKVEGLPTKRNTKTTNRREVGGKAKTPTLAKKNVEKATGSGGKTSAAAFSMPIEDLNKAGWKRGKDKKTGETVIYRYVDGEYEEAGRQ